MCVWNWAFAHAASAEAEKRVRVVAGAMVHPARDEDGFLPKDPRDNSAVFLRYGSIDVALGWPLRYSHFPAEVIDTKDTDAPEKIVEVLARKWWLQ
jgi:hypothetical protein